MTARPMPYSLSAAAARTFDMTSIFGMLLLTSALAMTGPANAATIEGTAEVVNGDGDELKIGHVAIRIHGIDASEVGGSVRWTPAAAGPA